MDDFNPYSAPKAGYGPGPFDAHGSGAWRDADSLVMSKDAELPDRCVKCNMPCGGWKIRRKLMWHLPYYYLLILLNILIYLAVAMFVRQTATVRVPLCPLHRWMRRRAIAVGWALAILGVVGVIVAIPRYPNEGWVFVACAISILVGAIYGVLGAKVVSVKKIDTRYVWLTRVDAWFLSEFPPWST